MRLPPQAAVDRHLRETRVRRRNVAHAIPALLALLIVGMLCGSLILKAVLR